MRSRLRWDVIRPLVFVFEIFGEVFLSISAFHQHAAAGATGKQLLPTVATPVHLKSLVPVTTASTTQHHGNGLSYTAFTQPSHASAIPLAGQLKTIPQQSLLQTQPSYYNVAASTNVQQQQQQQQHIPVYYRSQAQQQQQQQQQQQVQQQTQRLQVYPTATSPLQKTPLVYTAGQFAHPVPSQYAAYAYGSHQPAAGLFQPQGAFGKITYAPNGAAAGSGGRGGSIYLLH
ncbi:methylcytosine dioxygenase TET-like [Anopheles nili]|uniref:methylcytosine dioxygenase TET-like n=1 Tax=Anopheles nili TaxID=185578 RepID=UPI00237AE41A|nr:methylcytosine dioxygenase TET-like [Anopheles nili]